MSEKEKAESEEKTGVCVQGSRKDAGDEDLIGAGESDDLAVHSLAGFDRFSRQQAQSSQPLRTMCEKVE